ncbi:DUF924 domain-containing protein [Pikeienuella piscinae]|uniref:DUF924 domain-containing protein n=1 Tax=Pikeienuella piscinae TaxID=2748098 RepID=A0A7M3T6U6_9RHOB|nr:DUF924 family protein [Pikeienuella piscinae]QIE57727.1 DUF924 domain-containing protein [Pikeienuella piscinae]
MSVATAEAVTRFWVDEVGPKGWYAVDEKLDERIRAEFEDTWRAAASGKLELWLLRPASALALLIVLDQFPRNMFRGDQKAFSTDAKALAAAKKAISLGHDLHAPEPERQFFYLPLMHSECLVDQDRCVRLILTRMPKTGAQNLPHAREHREVIRQFGRFPYRNEALGRVSTISERNFLAEHGYAA